MVLTTYGIQCLQGLLFGFSTVGVLLVLLAGISRLLKDGFDLGDDL